MSAALIPTILNVFIIGALLISQYCNYSIHIIAWRITIAGATQCLLQIILLWHLKLSIKPIFKAPIRITKRILTNFLPIIFGASIPQISLLLDTFFASFLITSSLSWLYYAKRVTQFPLGIFGVALATVILPGLSLNKKKQSTNPLNSVLNWGLKLTSIISIPATIAMIMISFPIIISLFQYDQFKSVDAMNSSYALMIFSLSLMPSILVKILISAIYSRHQTQKAIKVGIICLLFNVLSNTLVVTLFYQYELCYLSLAASTTITSILNSILLFHITYKDLGFKPNPTIINFIYKVIIASTIMAIMLYFIQGDIRNWFTYSSDKRILYLLYLIFTGTLTYSCTLYMLGVRFKDIKP